MADPTFVEARRLCGMPDGEHGGTSEAAGDCRCKAIAEGIRAGLERAAQEVESERFTPDPYAGEMEHACRLAAYDALTDAAERIRSLTHPEGAGE